MMDRIIARVERDEDWRRGIDAKRPAPEKFSADAIAAAAVQIAQTIGAQAIVALTASGSTVLRVARERPDCPVLGLTTSMNVARRLALVWGVHATLTKDVTSMAEAVENGAKLARRDGFVKKGDEIVVVAGVPFGQPGTTNALQVTRL